MKNVSSKDFFVLGYFGFESDQLDGQTVKTRSVHQLFEEKLGGRVAFYDTEKLKKSPLSILTALFCILRSKHLIYLPAQNNLKHFFPTLFALSILFRFHIHYFVVGGWLMKFISEKPSLIIKLRRISGIYVETQRMKTGLNEVYDLNNVVVFPNFRFFVPQIRGTQNSGEVLNLVFFSRVNRNKGLEFIFEMLDEINFPVHLDFYGPIYENDREYFENNISRFGNVKYLGVLSPENVKDTLEKYDLLILPTKYFTEGLPGAIVDAYISGIPVLVTDWLHAREFVIHEVTGFIVPFENGIDEAIKYLNRLNYDRFLLYTLKQNAIREAVKYSEINAWQIIKDKIQI